MIDLGILMKGLVIGFSSAAPIGPIGVLCIKRTITNGRTIGFVTGMGGATIDLIYAIIGGFGLTLISDFLINQKNILQLFGGLFIIYLGFKVFSSKKTNNHEKSGNQGLLISYLSSFLIAVTSPMAIVYYVAVFAGLGLVATIVNYYEASTLAAGVFLGSTIWWIILSNVVGILKDKVNDKGLIYINRFSGVILISFGIFALWSIL